MAKQNDSSWIWLAVAAAVGYWLYSRSATPLTSILPPTRSALTENPRPTPTPVWKIGDQWCGGPTPPPAPAGMQWYRPITGVNPDLIDMCFTLEAAGSYHAVNPKDVPMSVRDHNDDDVPVLVL